MVWGMISKYEKRSSNNDASKKQVKQTKFGRTGKQCLLINVVIKCPGRTSKEPQELSPFTPPLLPPKFRMLGNCVA